MRREILIDAADGVAKAMLVRPDNAAVPDGQLRGVILYMDAMGPRESLYGMAQRLADAGHVGLVPDLFYRFGAYGPFTGTSFGDDTARAQIMKMLQGTSQEMTLVGNYTPDTYSMRMAMNSRDGGSGVGTMSMKMHVDAKRVGECRGDES